MADRTDRRGTATVNSRRATKHDGTRSEHEHGYESWKRTDARPLRDDRAAWQNVAEAERNALGGRTQAAAQARGARMFDDWRGTTRPTTAARWRGPPAYTGYDTTGKLEESGYAEHGRHMPDASHQDAATRPSGSSLSATAFRQPPHHYAEARRASYRGRGPRDYARSDDRIAEDIHHRLAADPDVDASDIEFSVEKGWVQLRGTVATRGEKYRAELLAADCQGVADVHNALKRRGGRESYGFQDKRGRVGQRQ